MKFTDAIFAHPANLFVDVEAVPLRVPYFVINQPRLGLGAVEDARVVLR